MQKLPFNHWTLFILWQSGHKRRFKIACKEWGLTREEIIKIITV
jgi:hypothetical protein